MSIATLSESLSAMDEPREMLRGKITFPSPAAAQGVDQAEASIEGRVGSGCSRCRPIEGLERLSPCLALGVRPNGDRIEPGMNEIGERRRGVGGRHALRLATPHGWKGIPDTMQNKLENGMVNRLPIGAQKTCGLRPLHRRVSL